VEILDEVVQFVLGVFLEFFDAVRGDKQGGVVSIGVDR